MYRGLSGVERRWFETMCLWALATACGEVTGGRLDAASGSAGPSGAAGPSAVTPPESSAERSSDSVPAGSAPDYSLAPALDNGQTGSPNESECTSASGCEPDLDQYTHPQADFELLSAQCTSGRQYDGARFPSGLPVCACMLAGKDSKKDSPSTLEVDLGASEPLQDIQLLQCSWENRLTPGCVYCANEFPGCQRGEPALHCETLCTAFVERARKEMQTPHTASTRFADCVQDRCQVVVQIDDQCANVRYPPQVEYDCSLSNQELLSLSPIVSWEQRLAMCRDTSPAPPCASARDCSGALACNGSQCGLCGDHSSCAEAGDDFARCQAELDKYVCASDEVCLQGVCVLRQNAACVDVTADCPPYVYKYGWYDCELSGIDRTRGRGNAETRSRCPTLR